MENIGSIPLETKRLVLSRFTLDDANDMFNNWACDDEVTRYLTWKPHKDIEDTIKVLSYWIKEYEKENTYRWCIRYKDGEKAIGSIDVCRLDEALLCANIGYCMSKEYWNRGIMTEALGRIIEYLLKDVGLMRIEAYHDIRNPASGAVMRKNGMKLEGIKRSGGRNNDGNFCDLAIYSILMKDI